jgi:hypothetical protein
MANRRERSAKVMSRGQNGEIIDHTKYIKTYRHHVMRVIRNIESGTVDGDDMDKLRNFCLMALALMDTVPISQIQGAWRDAEILSFEHPAVAEVEAVHAITEYQRVERASVIPQSFRKE